MSDTESDPYQPESRRPIAQVFRLTAGWCVRVCVRLGIHPDWISYASVAASVVSAILFWQSKNQIGWLLLAPVPSLLRLWLNMLDGMVALESGKASRRGEILNDLPDRLSDWIVFAGIAHSGWANLALAYWAGGVALLVAYVGTFGQAVGAGRQFGGVMAKPWRIVVVSLAAVLTWWRVSSGEPVSLGVSGPADATIMDAALGLVVLGGIQSIWARLRKILRHLDSS